MAAATFVESSPERLNPAAVPGHAPSAGDGREAGDDADLVREAASDVLADPTYRRSAERMQDEIAALPGPDHAVTLLERLATERQPLLSG